MPDQSENSSNSTLQPAEQKPQQSPQVPLTFYERYIKPILGKLILAGIILILLVILVNYIFKALKKDHNLEMMLQKNELLQQQISQDIKAREGLEKLLKESYNRIDILNKHDAEIILGIQKIDEKIEKIKLTSNEKIKAVLNYNSAELLEYYRNLPEIKNDY